MISTSTPCRASSSNRLGCGTGDISTIYGVRISDIEAFPKAQSRAADFDLYCSSFTQTRAQTPNQAASETRFRVCSSTFCRILVRLNRADSGSSLVSSYSPRTSYEDQQPRRHAHEAPGPPMTERPLRGACIWNGRLSKGETWVKWETLLAG